MSDKYEFGQQIPKCGAQAASPAPGRFQGVVRAGAGRPPADGAGGGQNRNAAGARVAPRGRRRGGCVFLPGLGGADPSSLVSCREGPGRSSRATPRRRSRGRPTRPAWLRAAARAPGVRGIGGSCGRPRGLRCPRCGAQMLLLQVAASRSTVLPTGFVQRPSRSILRPTDTAMSLTRSCSSPFSSIQPLTIWMRSRLALCGSRSAATRKVGARPDYVR